MERTVQAELLDELPASDPRAVQSRRDLRRVNAWMGNARLVADQLRLNQKKHLVELGAGDGTFLLKVAQRLGIDDVEATLIDRCDLLTAATKDEFARLGWKVRLVRSDVFEWLGSSSRERSDVILANLFLHHFQDEQLKHLLALIASRTNFMIACEPARTRLGLAGVQMLPLIGCNRVTRHDAHVSVQAGFFGRELSALWPHPENWRLSESPSHMFSHLFTALRIQ